MHVFDIRIFHSDNPYSEGLRVLNLPTLFDRRKSLCRSFYLRTLKTDSKLKDLVPEPVVHHHNFRDARKLPLFKCRTKRFSSSFLPTCVRKWDQQLSLIVYSSCKYLSFNNPQFFLCNLFNLSLL